MHAFRPLNYKKKSTYNKNAIFLSYLCTRKARKPHIHMPARTTVITFVLAMPMVLLAVICLGLRRFSGHDSRDAAMHTHEVLAERRRLLAIEKEKKEKKKK